MLNSCLPRPIDGKIDTAPHELSNCSKFANFDVSNRIRTLLFVLRIYGRFDSSKFANFEQVREPMSSVRGSGSARAASHNLNNCDRCVHWIRMVFLVRLMIYIQSSKCIESGIEFHSYVCQKKP